MKKISVSNLSISYSNNCILNAVSVDFENNKIHGIVGENGSGKTSLFNLIYHHSKFSNSIKLMNIESIGYLQTELYMFPRITGEEFIFYCLNARNCKIEKKEIAKLNEIFMLPLNRYAENYSTGMVKKLYLLTLILQNNSLLLLDEPFNGLDIQSVILVTELLKKISETGVLVLLSSHDLYHMVNFCDTITYIQNKKFDVYTDKSDFFKIIINMENNAKEKLKFI